MNETESNYTSEEEMDLENPEATDLDAADFDISGEPVLEAENFDREKIEEETFQLTSLEEAKELAQQNELEWKSVAISPGGDVLKRENGTQEREWVYRDPDGKEISNTKALAEGEAKERHEKILNELYEQGYSISEYQKPGSETLIREIYFADERGNISYEIFEADKTKKEILPVHESGTELNLQQDESDGLSEARIQSSEQQPVLIDLTPLLQKMSAVAERTASVPTDQEQKTTQFDFVHFFESSEIALVPEKNIFEQTTTQTPELSAGQNSTGNTNETKQETVTVTQTPRYLEERTETPGTSAAETTNSTSTVPQLANRKSTPTSGTIAPPKEILPITIYKTENSRADDITRFTDSGNKELTPAVLPATNNERNDQVVGITEFDNKTSETVIAADRPVEAAEAIKAMPATKQDIGDKIKHEQTTKATEINEPLLSKVGDFQISETTITAEPHVQESPKNIDSEIDEELPQAIFQPLQQKENQPQPRATINREGSENTTEDLKPVTKEYNNRAHEHLSTVSETKASEVRQEAVIKPVIIRLAKPAAVPSINKQRDEGSGYRKEATPENAFAKLERANETIQRGHQIQRLNTRTTQESPRSGQNIARENSETEKNHRLTTEFNRAEQNNIPNQQERGKAIVDKKSGDTVSISSSFRVKLAPGTVIKFERTKQHAVQSADQGKRTADSVGLSRPTREAFTLNRSGYVPSEDNQTRQNTDTTTEQVLAT